MKLEMLRGINDTIIYAQREDDTLQDQIYQVKITSDEGKLVMQEERILTPSSMVGNIISLELDPRDLLNVDNVQQDSNVFNESKDHYDRLIIIDSEFRLISLQLPDCSVIDEKDLNELPDLKEALMKDVVNSVDFPRLSASHRCLHLKGKTYNYETGFSWDFNFNSESAQFE